MKEQILDLYGDQTICGYCNRSFAAFNKKCTYCSYPQNGTPEEINEFNTELALKKIDLEDARKQLNNARWVLFGVGGITLVYSLIVGLSKDDMDVLIEGTVLGLIYIILGVWASNRPFLAILIGFLLYLLVQVLSAILEPATIIQGIIIKILIVTAFIRGIGAGKKAEKLFKQVEKE